jgi:hypothetical protein
MSANKLYYYAILLLLLIPLSAIQPQVQNLILTDTTITTTVTFIGTNSITAGPNFTISNTGSATFLTGGQIYLRAGVSVVLGGVFKTILDTALVGVEDENGKIVPEGFSLDQNYPNPFNPTTKIKFSIPELSFVTLKVFDVVGNEIETLVNQEEPAGSYEVQFSAIDLPSGIYFYQLRAGNFVETKKMILIK